MKTLEQKEEITSKSSRRQEIVKLWVEINKIETNNRKNQWNEELVPWENQYVG